MKARLFFPAATAAAFALTCALPAASRAVSVQTRVAPGNNRYMLNESGHLGYRGPLLVSLDYNALNDPLVELSRDRERRLSTVLDGLQTFDLTIGARIAGLLSLNATLPLNLVHPDGAGRSWALGDARVFAKVPLLEPGSAWQLSIVPELRAPTGDEALFVSDGSVGFGLLVAAERRFNGFSVVGNLGYRRSRDAIFRELDYRQKVPFALGVNVPLTERWSANGELAGARVLPFNGAQNPSELYAGARFQATPAVVFHAGASLGAFTDVPSANYRVMAGLKIEPFADPAPAAQPPQQAGSASWDRIGTEQANPAPAPTNRFVIDQEIQFAHDSAAILPQSRAVLDQVVERLAELGDHPGTLEVEGHTNELGSDAYNLNLSERRAAAVTRYLGDRAVQADRLRATGYGERRPKAGSEKLDRAERLRVNRRVEFKFRATPRDPE